MRTLVIWLLMTIAAFGQLVPTGPASWTDTTDGSKHRAFAPGGEPVLCYQEGEEWQFISDDWVQVNDTLWKSVKGNHKVWASSGGRALYAVGNHYLGTLTTHLVKFKLADYSWEVLQTSEPDSVVANGNRLRFYGIWPGVDKELQNNPKVLKQYSESFYFSQEARDSLENWGPWGGRYIGTATKLDVDSLNCALADAIGSFEIDSNGHMTDDWIEFDSGGTRAFYMQTANLQTKDSICQNIKVKKFLVKQSSDYWLVELFDPAPTKQLPAGTLYHHAVFGPDDPTGLFDQSIENSIRGPYVFAPSAGTLDSLHGYLRVTDAGAPFEVKMSIYEGNNYSSGMVCIDSILAADINNESYDWHGDAVYVGASINTDSCYCIAAWSENHNAICYMAYHYEVGLQDSSLYKSLTYGAWPSPATFSQQTARQYAYATYTEGEAPEGRQPAQIWNIVDKPRLWMIPFWRRIQW